ncbi:MAG: PilC/PilY family type IV pilus protein, partial [Nitrospira sp.]|nr:PilC/PilY family type IV pilus protein [Nitrospira sp.]
MLKKILLILSLLTIIIPAALTYADDTEIYGFTTTQIKPNVLIIFDNSGSMNDDIRSAIGFDPAVTYTVASACGGNGNVLCDSTTIYRWRGVEQVWQPHSSLSNVQAHCTTAYNSLHNQGMYTGVLSTAGYCRTSGGTFATGNYINFLVSNTGGVDPSTPKVDIAKRVITELVKTTDSVNFGLMVFNNSEGGHLARPILDMGVGTNRQDLINAINNITANTWTPLAETLYESMRYFSGQSSQFNSGTNYTSPIQYSCQKNYVIIVTDGMSTEDKNPVLKTLCNNGDCDGDGFEPDRDPRKSYYASGSDYLDDVAKYMHDNDMSSSLNGTQNVITYTVGFGLLSSDDGATLLLTETADNGGGKYYSAYNTQSLNQAFTEIIGTIIQDNTSFVAPVVPVSPENKTFSGDRVYIGFFKPSVGAFWSGNLKKYGLDLNNGIVIDKNGVPAIDSNGDFLETSVSYWSTGGDGGFVEEGGVGEVLLARTTARNIYTYLGTSTALTNASNAFTTTNAALTYGMVNMTNDTEKNSLINFIHGYDAYSGTPNIKRDWILGDILHSRPYVVHYSTTRSVSFVGANDGMMHAFEDSTGEELWGFIPPDLLGNLKSLTSGTTHPFFVDSSPKLYIQDANGNGIISRDEGDKVILIFGERRGGSSYYALDVTDPDAPVYLWRIGDAIASPAIGSVWTSTELGQSWSEPEIAKVIIGSDVKYVFFMGAGYDTLNEDVVPRTTTDPMKGRPVYAVDVLTGAKLWEYSYTTSVTNDSGSTKPDMTYAIPSSVSVIDSNGNGYADRLYVGDVGGQIWRFDVGSNSTSSWTGKIIFRSNPGGDGSTGRKIFYPPDFVQEIGYDVLYFGTGDREHPRNTDFVDRLYGIKDNSSITTALTESNLVD